MIGRRAVVIEFENTSLQINLTSNILGMHCKLTLYSIIMSFDTFEISCFFHNIFKNIQNFA